MTRKLPITYRATIERDIRIAVRTRTQRISAFERMLRYGLGFTAVLAGARK